MEYQMVYSRKEAIMGILKLIFLPIYLPFALVIGLLKLLGIGGFMSDIFKRM